jgi:hypothetical protein
MALLYFTNLTTCSAISDAFDSVSHDRLTRMLQGPWSGHILLDLALRTLFTVAGGSLIVDDTVVAKPYARLLGEAAYLSTSASGDQAAVNARDRLGKGPWKNAKGLVIAKDGDDLHGTNNLNKQTALTEKGEPVNGRGDTPNMHDILTGSQADGRAFTGSDDRTCRNWTSSGEGAAMVGHHDRQGLRDDEASKSWNASHLSRGTGGGCSQEALRSTGGNGFFYCFAVN